jgi:hypothetical protein
VVIVEQETFVQMTDREHDIALELLSVEGYIAYLLARQDGKSHVYAMRQGWLAR